MVRRAPCLPAREKLSDGVVPAGGDGEGRQREGRAVWPRRRRILVRGLNFMASDYGEDPELRSSVDEKRVNSIDRAWWVDQPLFIHGGCCCLFSDKVVSSFVGRPFCQHAPAYFWFTLKFGVTNAPFGVGVGRSSHLTMHKANDNSGANQQVECSGGQGISTKSAMLTLSRTRIVFSDNTSIGAVRGQRFDSSRCRRTPLAWRRSIADS